MKIRYIDNALIEGDGQKYVRIDGELIPFVARSATERLRHGDRRFVIIEEHNEPEWGKHFSADLPRERIPVDATIEQYQLGVALNE
jgi:hypothetical protein